MWCRDDVFGGHGGFCGDIAYGVGLFSFLKVLVGENENSLLCCLLFAFLLMIVGSASFRWTRVTTALRESLTSSQTTGERLTHTIYMNA